MDHDLADELVKQKDILESEPRVSVEPQDLVSRARGHAYQGSVEIHTSADRDDLQITLDLYKDGETLYRIDAKEVAGDDVPTPFSETYRRRTAPDAIILVTSLIHRITGARLDLDTSDWGACRVVLHREYLTARRTRRTSTVMFRGDYFECREALEHLASPDDPTEFSWEINGDVPPKHTVERAAELPHEIHDHETEDTELPF